MKNIYFIFKKGLLTSMLFVWICSVFAFDYTISFTGSGLSTTVDSVVVQNITKGTTALVPISQVLHLTDVASGVNDVAGKNTDISVYPNPVVNVSQLSFYAPSAGNVRISIFDNVGRAITSTNQNLSDGNHSFQISLPFGMYFVNVAGNGFNYSQKVISSAQKQADIHILQHDNQVKTLQRAKAASTVTMLFSAGDLLLFKSYSGNYSTIITDSPTGDKTIDFEFIECKDANNNYYPVIKIGDKIWMASNLNTTKYRNGEDIPNVTDDNSWKYLYTPGWCNQDNDTQNGHIYGKLYNYYAVADVRNIAPVGWHVATKDEWDTMINYVDTHWSFIVKPTKALASRDGWRVSTIENTPGYQPQLNNFSGFSALPGGNRGGYYNGTFFNLGEGAFWWTATDFGNISDAYYVYFTFETYYTSIDGSKKQYGSSVRCVKD